ncbi:MAG: efflux RND transporter permease subunit, partial [Myxococcota bacterium]
RPAVRVVVRNRYLTLSTAIALLIATFGFIAGGRINFTFLPKIESDRVFARLEMPVGTPADVTSTNIRLMEQALAEVLEEGGGADHNSRGVLSQLGVADMGGQANATQGSGGSGAHIGEVSVYLKSPEERDLRTLDLVKRWREKLQGMPGVKSLKFTYTTGAGNEAPIKIGVSHNQVPMAEAAARELAGALGDFAGVSDIDDGIAEGKRQLDFVLKPEARSLGIEPNAMARQVRAAFYGAEASRQQRERDEIRVFVRLPRDERDSLTDLEELRVRTAQGGEVPLRQAAQLSWGRAYTSIARLDYQRVLYVEADVDDAVTNANKVIADLKGGVMPDLKEKYPGLSYIEAGQQRDQAESLSALGTGFLLALLLMYALMAIPFRSYSQPLIIMTAIPFGIVGAVGGHMLMGYDLSILSMMGLVALSGVVVNDSLVLISAINTFRTEGMSTLDAVVAGVARRFRPILLTSLTTFLGLVPMIIETSVQARFLVPMALSLGFGVLFATFVILLLVPSLYLILADIKRIPQWLASSVNKPAAPQAAE